MIPTARLDYGFLLRLGCFAVRHDVLRSTKDIITQVGRLVNSFFRKVLVGALAPFSAQEERSGKEARLLPEALER